MGRKSRTAVRSAALVAVGALAGFGCDSTPEDSYYGPVIYEVLPETARGPFALEFAFADEEVWQYVDLSAVLDTQVRGKVYIMKGVEGQFPIIDALPGDLEYSPFWQVVEVDPPSGYEANQIKSLQTIKDADLGMTVTDRVMNCPVVDPDAEWTSNLGVPLEVFGVPPMPAQVIWGVGEDMPNAFNEYASQFGFSPSEFLAFLETPQEEIVTDENGEPVIDPETMEPVTQVVWPGFAFDPGFKAVVEMRSDQAFVTDADATDYDVRLQPVWHKTLRGFCLPDVADTAYTTETDDFGDTYVVGSSTAFVQFSPGQEEIPADPEADPPVEGVPGIPPAPYGNLLVFDAAPGAAGYQPLAAVVGVTTTDPTQVEDADDFEAGDVLGPLSTLLDPAPLPDLIYAPLIRQVAPATITLGGM